ncbi:MAG: hypothetical protein JO152_12020 [Mycobacteriaceae bacterium]|nr:hypothetical protein [Mycobacteriaceae bacterium]
MSIGDELHYSPGALFDYASQIGTFAGHLETIEGEARNLVNGLKEHFDSMGADAFHTAHMLINQGIDEGKDLIYRHGNTIETVTGQMQGYDGQAASSFQM